MASPYIRAHENQCRLVASACETMFWGLRQTALLGGKQVTEVWTNRRRNINWSFMLTRPVHNGGWHLPMHSSVFHYTSGTKCQWLRHRKWRMSAANIDVYHVGRIYIGPRLLGDRCTHAHAWTLSTREVHREQSDSEYCCTKFDSSLSIRPPGGQSTR